MFGCALLVNETTKSYNWLLETWLKAMDECAPSVVNTDDDKAMAKPNVEILLNSNHRLCMWHILQKVPEHLAHVFNTYLSFQGEFHHCIRDTVTVEEFENEWYELIFRYELRENEWLKNLQMRRKKWILAYFRTMFCFGMSITKISESTNKFFKDFVQVHWYVSMADIIDLSKLVLASDIRVIDFRVFISIWCGVNVDLACSKESNEHSFLFETLRQCGSLLSGYNGNVNNCVYALDEDCRTTVWTYRKDGEDGILDSFQPDDQLKKKKKISYVRTRKDVYKALGPGSEAESATVLTFASLFSSPYKGSELYMDIHEAPRDQRIQSLIAKVRFLPFVPEITKAGKEFASKTITSPFLCAQLRLLDGQFKNHWKVTFLGLQQKIEFLRHEGALPIHIFVMTDLPEGNWTGNYLGDLARDSSAFKLHVLRENDILVTRTSKKLADEGNGMKFGYLRESFDGMKKHCHPPLLPDILLYIEEVICSCALLGFVGTAGSTIAESVELMRKYDVCSGQGPH